jgi:hypothetical protein
MPVNIPIHGELFTKFGKYHPIHLLIFGGSRRTTYDILNFVKVGRGGGKDSGLVQGLQFHKYAGLQMAVAD